MVGGRLHTGIELGRAKGRPVGWGYPQWTGVAYLCCSFYVCREAALVDDLMMFNVIVACVEKIKIYIYVSIYIHPGPWRTSSGERAAWEQRLKEKARAAANLEDQTRRLLDERETSALGDGTGTGMGTGTTGVGATSGAGRGGLDGGLAQAVYDLKRRLADIEAKLEEEVGRKSRETENRVKKEQETVMKPAAAPAPEELESTDWTASIPSQLAALCRRRLLEAWEGVGGVKKTAGVVDEFAQVRAQAKSEAETKAHAKGEGVGNLSSPAPAPAAADSKGGVKSVTMKGGVSAEVTEPPRRRRSADGVMGWLRRRGGGEGKSGEGGTGTVAVDV